MTNTGFFSEKAAAAAEAKAYMNRCFAEFGKALIVSLERSCYPVLTAMKGKKCAAATAGKKCDDKSNGCNHCKMNGMYCEENQTDAMKAYAESRTKHNNDSEGPFATAKELRRFFTTMRISVIEGLVLSARNKTFGKYEKGGGEGGLFNGYFNSLPSDVQDAVRTVALDDKYQQEQKDRLERHWTEKFERLEEKRKEKMKSVEKKAHAAEIAFDTTRLYTKRSLNNALKKCVKTVAGKEERALGKYRKVLEDQVRHRLVGCGFEYPFETSLLSGVQDRWKKMEKMLLAMIKVENTTAGKEKYKPPDMPHVKNIYRFDVPILGRKSQLRGDIEKTIQMKSENLIEMEDNAELVELRTEFLNEVFYDDGDGVKGKDETRIIVDIQWDRFVQSWEAVTHVVNRDGSAKPINSRLKKEHYIIGAGLRQMIDWHEENLLNDEIARQAKAKKLMEKEAKKKRQKASLKRQKGKKGRKR